MAIEPQLPKLESKRETSRRFARIPVVVRGVDTDDERFRERTRTIMVHAHGGLVYLNASVGSDALLNLYNPETEEEQECRVTYLGDVSEAGQRVGIEFSSPAPHFWGVDFSATAPPQSVRPAEVDAGSARSSG